MKGLTICLLVAALVLQANAQPLYREALDVDYDDDTFAHSLTQCGNVTEIGQRCLVHAFPICNITEVGQAGCSLQNYTNQTIYNIIPGNNTHCLNESAPYYFQVMQGDPQKLVLWFYGGGACWNENISALGACAGYPGGPDYTTFVSVSPHTYTGGLFNRSRDDVPFNDWSLVGAPYCSGDLFVGDRIRVYTNESTNETIATAHQSGSNNTMAVLSWVFDNYPNVSQLVIAGCSAGSLGAQAWSNYIITHYAETRGELAPKTVVIADGYAGIFTENQRQLLPNYNAHNTPWAQLLPVEYRERMGNGSLFWCEVTNYLQDQFPNVTYVATQAAHDFIQLSYLNVLGMQSDYNYTHDATTPVCANETVPVYNAEVMGDRFGISPEGFFNITQAMYKGYITRGHNNFVPFVIKSSQHCFLGYDNVYEMVVNDTATLRNVSLVDWLDDIPLGDDTVDVNDPTDQDKFSAVCDIEVACLSEVFNHSRVVVDDLVVPDPAATTDLAGTDAAAETAPAVETAAANAETAPAE